MNEFFKRQASKILSCYVDSVDDILEKGGKPAFIGEIREYSGREFQKQASGKWKEILKEKESKTEKTTKNRDSFMDQFRNEITIEETRDIKLYTSDLFHQINGSLRSGKIEENLQEKVDTINNALDKLPSYNGMVNRWEPFYKGGIEDHINDYVKGEIAQLPSFLSTTKLTEAPDTIFSTSMKFEIESKNGKHIKEYSEYPKEEEVLFKPNSIFEVIDVKVNKYKSGMLKGKPMSLVIKFKEL